jgi:hypothetical protein
MNTKKVVTHAEVRDRLLGTKRGAKFPLGQVVMTCGVAAAIGKVDAEQAEGAMYSADIAGALARHESGDWGIMPDEDKTANEDALKYGERLMSAYVIWQDATGTHGTPEGTKIWIITERDRSATTVLFPDEY